MIKYITLLVMFLIMEIYFDTKKLKELCDNSKKANKKLGVKNAKLLFKRLSQLKSVNKLGDFKFDRPHPLKGDRKTEFAITIYAGFRLTFKAKEPKKTPDGDTLWKEVTKINIVYIGDYHE
ncbi:hypothetical protein [uncultured Gammaproteobacteria bacterium]|nr:hypothetical protein [uncultured Gammaproteobacteria bacterium]